MSKRKILQMIERDDYLGFSQFLHNGGDVNMTIYGKTLIEHALLKKSDLCLHALFLYGPDLTKLMEREDWARLIYDHDSWYMQMIQELSATSSNTHSSRIQLLLDKTCKEVVGNYPLSYRDMFSFHTTNHAYFSMLACGIHWFEFVHWDYLTKHLKSIFRCEDPEFSSREGKLAMLVTVCDLDQIDRVPIMSLRIKGYLVIREFPSSDIDKELKKAQDNEELIIGVRYSSAPSLVIEGSSENVDISSLFLTRPYFEKSYLFQDYLNWDHQLNTWVHEFKRLNGVFPNIMLASDSTYARIEMVANTNGREQIRSSEGKMPEAFVMMGGFQGLGYLLDFCVEGRCCEGEVKLIHDFGGGHGEDKDDENLETLAS